MSMNMLRLTLASAPALLLFRASPEESARHGTVLFYHGFGESKDGYVEVLQQLAQAGFLAVGIDGVGHGERRYPDFKKRFPPFEPQLIGNLDLEAAFLAVVRATVQELPQIIDALTERGWIHAQRVGITGHSFGGFVTYAAVVADQRIQVAAPVVGSPQWKLPWPDSPHLHPDRFFPTALLSQTAGKDTRVWPDFAHAFHQQLAPYYIQAPERLHYIEYPDSPHDLTNADWQSAWNAVVQWFSTYLAAVEH
jgi:alpha-beta hydrolase superfamily lysophospholipase